MIEKAPSSLMRKKTESIRQISGDHFADIFYTASELFPSFKDRFNGVGFAPSNTPGFSYRGRSTEHESWIEIGPASKQGVSKFLPIRVEKRFGINRDILSMDELGPELARIIAFAHEVGHLVQDNNTEMMRFFGETIPDIPDGVLGDNVAELNEPENYVGYVNRLNGINADYIARCILANTEIGEMLGVELPEYEPADWQKWAEDCKLQIEDLEA